MWELERTEVDLQYLEYAWQTAVPQRAGVLKRDSVQDLVGEYLIMEATDKSLNKVKIILHKAVHKINKREDGNQPAKI